MITHASLFSGIGAAELAAGDYEIFRAIEMEENNGKHGI